MSIRSLDVVPWAIPLRAPLATARGPIHARRGFLVVLEDERGQRGVGEAAPHPAAAPAAWMATRDALAAVARTIRGAEPASLLGRGLTADPAAACGVDVALHDLVGRRAGVPVSTLLGGAVRAGVPVSALGVDTAGGFTCAKIKASRDVDATIARVAAARRTCPALALRVDANGAWDVATARRAARALRRLDVEWLEQPIAPGDVDGLVRVRAAGVPIAADEAVTDVADVDALACAIDVVVVKLVQVGGLAAARAVLDRAAALGLGVTVTSAIDTAVGTAAALHLAASIPGPLRACGLATATLLAGDVTGETLVEGPRMLPPSGPGLGVTVDPARLARWRVRDAA